MAAYGDIGDGSAFADIVLDSCQTPDSIEARSFAIIDAEFGPEKPFSGNAWSVARRLIHAAGDCSLAERLVLPEAAIAAGMDALSNGAVIYTDTEMARAGMPLRRLTPLGCRVECILAPPGTAPAGQTRAYAGVAALGERLGGSIFAVGNAPTALLALFDHLDRGGPAPALVVGMPVGFVNAAESKELLLRRNVHSLVVRGRRGGSPLAAAAINALATLVKVEAALP
jgi:precorrin-8X/cobalt-precorrin-8 methylmutase